MDVTFERPGSVAVIEAAYVEQGPRLYRSLLAYSGDPHLAEDAMAEAFAQALRRGSSVRQPERWIWYTAFRLVAGALKDRNRDVPPVDGRSYELPETPLWLGEALASLPDGQRAAVVLHYYADLRIRDVAHVMGTTSAAVKVSLMRARRRLRTLLESDDG